MGLTIEELAIILTRLDTKVEALMKKFDDNAIACTKCIEDHEDRLRSLEFREPGNPKVADKVEELEDRIRTLENWQWKVIGISIGASSAISILAGAVIL